MTKTLLCIAGTALIPYLIGSVNFGIPVTWFFIRKDIRTLGSGNTGTTNVLRSVGLVPGILTGVGDFVKGTVSMIIGLILFREAGLDPYVGRCMAAVFVLLGHLFPVWYQFKGGKGIMTTGGCLVMLDPLLTLICVLVYLVVFLAKRITSLAGLVAGPCIPVVNLILSLLRQNKILPTGGLFNGTDEVVFSTMFSALIAVLFYITLRDNLKRLKEGKETPLVVAKLEEEDSGENRT